MVKLKLPQFFVDEVNQFQFEMKDSREKRSGVVIKVKEKKEIKNDSMVK